MRNAPPTPPFHIPPHLPLPNTGLQTAVSSDILKEHRDTDWLKLTGSTMNINRPQCYQWLINGLSMCQRGVRRPVNGRLQLVAVTTGWPHHRIWVLLTCGQPALRGSELDGHLRSSLPAQTPNMISLTATSLSFLFFNFRFSGVALLYIINISELLLIFFLKMECFNSLLKYSSRPGSEMNVERYIIFAKMQRVH